MRGVRFNILPLGEIIQSENQEVSTAKTKRINAADVETIMARRQWRQAHASHAAGAFQEIPVRCNGDEGVLPEHRGSWRERDPLRF